jgi:hypothetical protein
MVNIFKRFASVSTVTSDIDELEEFSNTKNVNTVFGIPLVDAASRSDPLKLVPMVVRNTTTFLNIHGTTCEGLYRIPGRISTINEYMKLFNTKNPIDFMEEPDIYSVDDVSGLLTRWLNQLPESLFTNEHLKLFISENLDCDTLKNNLKVLPECNRETIKVLMYHFKKVAEKSQVNKMTSKNLVLCLYAGDPEAHAIQLLIDNYDVIFS